MYTIDDNDKLISIGETIPQSSPGAPLPHIISDEKKCILVYYADALSEEWKGRAIGLSSENRSVRFVVVIKFERTLAHMFGFPNDEAITGHPLTTKGLEPYGAWIVENSSWMRILTRMNSVHPFHSDDFFSQNKHYIFTFHDSTFECIAESFILEIYKGSMKEILLRGFQTLL